MLSVILIAACSVTTTLALVARLHKRAFALIRGHNALFDLIFTVILGGIMVSGGSLTGLMISAVTGVMLSGTLMTFNYTMGGTKVRNPNFKWLKPTTWFKWQLEDYPAKGDLNTVKGKLVVFAISMYTKAKDLVISLIDKIKNAKANKDMAYAV